MEMAVFPPHQHLPSFFSRFLLLSTSNNLVPAVTRRGLSASPYRTPHSDLRGYGVAMLSPCSLSWTWKTKEVLSPYTVLPYSALQLALRSLRGTCILSLVPHVCFYHAPSAASYRHRWRILLSRLQVGMRLGARAQKHPRGTPYVHRSALSDVKRRWDAVLAVSLSLPYGTVTIRINKLGRPG